MWRLVAALLLAGARPGESETVRRLGGGSIVTASLAAAEEHRYRLEMPEDEYAVVAVRGETALPPATVDGHGATRATHGREVVFFLRGGAGPYRLTVKGQGTELRYRLDVLGARAAPSQHPRRLLAERRLVAGRHQASDGIGDAYRRALIEYTAARDIWRGLPDLAREAATLEEMAGAHAHLAEHDAARRALDQALRLWRGLADARGEARNLQLRATLEARAGDNRRARALGLDALARSRKLKDAPLEAQALNTLAAARLELGEITEAEADYAAALARSRSVNDRTEEARALAGAGHVATLLGRYDDALEILREALNLWRATGDAASEAAALGNLGSVHLALGRDEDAERLFLEAHERASRQSDRRFEVHALLNLGAVHQLRGGHGPAMTAFGRAHELATALAHPGLQARAGHRLGRLCALEGRHTEAIEHYRRALGLVEPTGDTREVSAILADVGWSQLREAPAAAAEAFRRGRELAAASADSAQEAAHLAGLATVARRAGDLEDARQHAAEALDRIETGRTRLERLDAGASHLASRQDYYELNVAVLMDLEAAQPGAGQAARALHVVERGRARGLLDMLGEPREQLRARLPADLRRREQQAREALSRASSVHWQPGERGAENVRRQAAEVRDRLREYQAVVAEVRAASPHYASMMQPEPLSAAAIQEQVLDGETALLTYALGREHSYAWLLTRESVAHARLPSRTEIDALARRAFLALAHPRQATRGELDEARTALGRVLLGSLPIPETVKRLLVVADGALHQIPFAALPDPRASTEGTPLLERYEIVSAPSASVVAVLRAETGARPAAPRRLAAFADPVFEAADPRVTRDGDAPAASGPAGTDDGLARLTHSRSEAEAALAFVPPEDRLAAFDFAASRAAALDPSLRSFRIVHFATHGILNARHPELSGLALSLVDPSGRPQDGFLSLHDVYSLELGADLVVLSGCRTGAGKETRGEGLVGLARGFMYAGAPRVVASLWSVGDRGSAELMSRFYKAMFADGRRPADALRAAQLSLRQEPRWSHPSYWSGFALFGEWR